MKRFRAWLPYGIGLVIIVLMIWDLLFSDHGYFVYKDEYKQKQNLESDIRLLKEEQKKVNTKIISLRENPKVLEQVIHRELGYVYPDEYMLIMPKIKQENTKETEKRSGHE